MKKTLSILLLLSLAAQVACAGSPSEVGGDTTAQGGGETTAASGAATDAYGRDIIASAVPDGLDFGGQELRIFSRNDSGFEYEFCVEEANGDVLSDAVYARNREVEEQLNITIVHKTEPNDSGGNHLKGMIASINAGDDEYDFTAMYSSQGAKYVIEGYFLDLNALKYLDFSKPWWNQEFAEELEINGNLPIMLGDISLSSIMRTNVTFFNKELYDEYYDESIYDIVKSGKWTLDTLSTMTRDIYRDLDGSGSMDENDFYALGFRSAATPLDAFIAALDLSITTKNSDGIPELTFYNERSVEIFDKLYSIVKESPGTYTNDRSVAAEAANLFPKMFAAGQLIFDFAGIGDTELYRDMNTDYGILPLPKYDEAQEKYQTLPHNSFSVIAVPKTNTRLDMTSAAIELFCQKNYESVTPIYYETVLKSKYFRDDESSQMLDLVMDGICLNFGSVYQRLGIAMIGDLMRTLPEDFASEYASKKSSYEAALADTLEKLMNN